jgi:hypothetical protein
MRQTRCIGPMLCYCKKKSAPVVISKEKTILFMVKFIEWLIKKEKGKTLLKKVKGP